MKSDEATAAYNSGKLKRVLGNLKQIEDVCKKSNYLYHYVEYELYVDERYEGSGVLSPTNLRAMVFTDKYPYHIFTHDGKCLTHTCELISTPVVEHSILVTTPVDNVLPHLLNVIPHSILSTIFKQCVINMYRVGGTLVKRIHGPVINMLPTAKKNIYAPAGSKIMLNDINTTITRLRNIPYNVKRYDRPLSINPLRDPFVLSQFTTEYSAVLDIGDSDVYGVDHHKAILVAYNKIYKQFTKFKVYRHIYPFVYNTHRVSPIWYFNGTAYMK